MPLYNWVQVTEEGRMEYVCRNIELAAKVDIQSAWETIYDDYLRRYGLSKLYKRLLEVKRKKALLELDYVVTRDRFNLTLIEIEEGNIEQMINNRGAGMSINTALVYLSKWVGYRLDWKEITTLEYFNIMDLYGKENKQQ
jgi:tricorn protease-like protein